MTTSQNEVYLRTLDRTVQQVHGVMKATIRKEREMERRDRQIREMRGTSGAKLAKKALRGKLGQPR